MKFVMSLVLAATFATPAFAQDKHKQKEIEAMKAMGELKQRRSEEKQKEIEAMKAMGELKQRHSEEKQKEIEAVKSMGKLKEELSKASKMNEEESKRGKNAYRLTEVKDPNAEAGKSEKSWSVGPWFGDNRKRILTPEEYRREEQEGKYTTYAGSEVGKNYKTVVGAKVKVKLGSSQ